MKTKNLTFGLTFIALAMLMFVVSAFGQVQTVWTEPTDGFSLNYINGFDLSKPSPWSSTALHWWSGFGNCTAEQNSHTRLRLMGYVVTAPWTQVDSCASHIISAVRDDSYVYFADNNQLYRKAAYASSTDTATLWGVPPAGYQLGAMATYNGEKYWTASGSGNFLIYNMDANGNFLGYYQGSGGAVKKLIRFRALIGYNSYDSLFVLTGNVLKRLDINPAGNWVTLSTGVSDFALRNESVPITFSTTRVYAAKGVSVGPDTTPTGTLVRLSASGGPETVIYAAGGQDQIMSVATDNQYIFLTEQFFSCFGGNCSASDPTSIWRQANPASSPNINNPFVPIVHPSFNENGGVNLRGDNQWLYYMRLNSIKRIATDTPGIVFDLQADALEVVQNSQDLNQSVRLVANKPTFARGYAHVAQNINSVMSAFYPSATLHGFLNGMEFADSPISSLNAPKITNNNNLDQLRGDTSASFLFELPGGWALPGNLTLTMTVNPSLSVPETVANPLANNSVQLLASAQIVKKNLPDMVFVPLATTMGIYNNLFSPSSRFVAIELRAISLLPVEGFFEDFRHLDSPVYKPSDDSLVPFDMSTDADSALTWLAHRDSVSFGGTGRPDLHYVGMVPNDAVPFNGIGSLSGRDLVVRMATAGTEAGYIPGNSPYGGRSLAHELGHNYGRQHVDQTAGNLNCNGTIGCGGSTPKNPAPYPYPSPCMISPVVTGNSAVFGFDPISQTAMLPCVGGDLMSYSTHRWISPFTWDAIFGQTPNASSAAEHYATPLSRVGGLPQRNFPLPTDPILLVHALIEPATNAATFETFYLLPTSAFSSNKVAASFAAAAALPTNSPVKFRFLDGVGATLTNFPAVLLVGTDDGAAKIGVVQFLPFDPQTRRIQLIYGDTVIAEKAVSGNAPVVNISSLSADAPNQQATLEWTATDADGDTLHYIVQYSADNGVTWHPLADGYLWQAITISTKRLPGGTQARLRVIASDGVNSTISTSAAFMVARHAPEIFLEGVDPDQRLPFGTVARLEAIASDAEDGGLDRSNLVWNLTGPTPRTGQGASLSLTDVSPGNYTGSVTVADSDLQTVTATRTFEILPLVVPNATEPVFDGTGSDPAYAHAAFVRVSLGSGWFVYARIIHANGNLYVSFTDLKFASGTSTRSVVGLRVDSNNSRNATAQTDDFGFYVAQDGIQYQLAGNGSTMGTSLSPAIGFSSIIARSSSGWSAELKIADGLLGGWDHAASVMLSHESITSLADNRNWPPLVNGNSPATWATAYFGTPSSPANRAPVASAGPNQTFNVGGSQTLFLNGSGSYDPDGNPVTYLWRQTAGPSVALTNSASATPSFVANPVNATTNLNFELRVTDGSLTSSPSPTSITLLAPPHSVPLNLAVANTNDNGPGSLRDTIASALPNGRISFASNVFGTITLTNGELVIDKSLTIIGPTTASVTVSGNHSNRVFHITAGTNTIANLTIANGNTNAQGAGIWNEAGCTLVLSNCTVSGNVSGNSGGGLANNGSVATYNCTFSRNQSANGGGIYTYAGPVVLRNCTVVSNTVIGATGAGGGVFNYSPVAGTSNSISGTLVAGNTAANHDDVIGVFTSSGYNLIGKIDYTTPSSGGAAGVTTRGLTNNVNHDLVGSVASPINAMIGPLQNNGGPTFTHVLLPGSPAIDKGILNGLFADQRGAPRPFDFSSTTNASGGDGSDIGAFELGRPPLNVQRAGANGLMVYWPSYYGDFTLQQNTNGIATANWSNVVVVPSDDGMTKTLIVNPATGHRFYRLFK